MTGRWRPWLKTGAVAIAVVISLVAARGNAQEPPVFPILYGGTVYVDGAPATAGTVIVATVGAREFHATTEPGGAYRNLLVAPPDKSYYFSPITFQLDGLTAQEQDVFLPAGSPTFKDEGYDLHFEKVTGAEPTPTVAALPTVTPTAVPSATATPIPTDDSDESSRGSVVWFVGVIGAGTAVVVAWYWLRTRLGKKRRQDG